MPRLISRFRVSLHVCGVCVCVCMHANVWFSLSSVWQIGDRISYSVLYITLFYFHVIFDREMICLGSILFHSIQAFIQQINPSGVFFTLWQALDSKYYCLDLTTPIRSKYFPFIFLYYLLEQTAFRYSHFEKVYQFCESCCSLVK